MQWDLQALSDFSMYKMLDQKLEFIPVCLEFLLVLPCITCLACKEEILSGTHKFKDDWP